MEFHFVNSWIAIHVTITDIMYNVNITLITGFIANTKIRIDILIELNTELSSLI